MTAFDKPFLFIDNPRGGTDQLDKMKAAGFQGAFGNVIDYPPEAWDVHRARARQWGMFFGPWGRTGHPPPVGTGFERDKAEKIISIGRHWGGPYVLNCEKEIDNSGNTITGYITSMVGIDDCALSTEAWPFGNVDWSPVAHLPVLPQIFPQDWWGQPPKMVELVMSRAEASKSEWHKRGIKCVYYTFGTYGNYTPANFELVAPYSLYTADAIGATNYANWKPTSTGFKGCVEIAPPVPPVPTPKQVRNKVLDAVDPWLVAQTKPVPLSRIKTIERIAGNEFTDEEWRLVTPTIKELLDLQHQ